MAIDLRKNKDALVKAYHQVLDDNDDTDWALFGYEGQNPVLKVVETGNGGVEEMSDDLNSGKMLYAFCRVQDPNTSLNKYVLIHWTGEGVPENLKLKFTSHLRDVQGFLKGIHITYPARCEEDIDLDDILKKVAKSSGANYSFHKETAKPMDAPAPVGTDYKRIIPSSDINMNNRDKFWAQAEKDEIQRQKQEKQKMDEERRRLDVERKEREVAETKERERKISEHMQEVGRQRQAEKRAEQINKEEEKKRWEKVQRESSIDEEERGHRSDQMRKERAAEAAQLVSSSTSSARAFFKTKSIERPDDNTSRGPPPPRKLKHNFGNQEQQQPSPPQRKEPIQLPKQPEPEPEVEDTQPEQPSQELEPEPEPVALPQTRDLMKQGLPPRQDSDEEEEEDNQDWNEPPAEHFEFREKRQPSFTEDYAAEERHHAATESHRVSGVTYFEEEEEDDSARPQQEEPPVDTFVPSPEQALCARALYDYQAADDTEITFDPYDIITNIEQIDEGWWQGFGPDGSYGMFPANYVQLIN
ncbi:drebrin-like protein [Plakobranchus ocellatus]|uniref:Drebrin-like protein n=1 Tax=Plakobranchus ocellatus TaxID=259542 RepID=A0AAV4B2A5_9GAST|nr:drebrin-like protein [Plakobranchus ocellatus]